jgi:tryptophan synthase alpha chain
LSFIPLITTRTDLTRAKYLDNLSQGFLYLVSSAAVTGGNLNTQMDAEGLNRINNYKLNNPLLLGFGIRDSETYKAALKYASGAIIGSAFIRALSKTNEALESRIINFVRTIR